MKKGTFYYGDAGVGKTTSMKRDFESWERSSKRLMTARDVARIAQNHGLNGIQEIVTSIDLFVDDIGHEANPVSHFGTVFSPMSELIMGRYDSCQEYPKLNMTTHFTSNLTPEELRVRYGDFVLDRLVEMCEWIQIDGMSFRK